MNKKAQITLHVGFTVEVVITPAMEKAIETANKCLLIGNTKVAAVRKIYPMIADLPREAIWYSFIHGASLSTRGAVTYYYNMRREFKKG